MIKIAVPNKGRLAEGALDLLQRAGLRARGKSDRALQASLGNGFQALFVRARDIPEFVADGAAQAGITGKDVVAETGRDHEALLDLEYGRCRLVVATHEDGVSTVSDLPDGTMVATSFPRLTRDFFGARDIPVDIAPVSGAAEIAPHIGVADVIVDLVSTGTTLKVNGLKEIATVLESSAILISRPAQDEFALRSHQKAIEAWEKGVFDDEVMPFPVPPKYRETVTRDTIPRAETTLEKLATLRPVFDRRYGSVTAGNASPLTDGAAALLLMEAKTAERLGYEVKAYLRSWSFAALDPNWQLLMGPALATPIALDRADMTLDDIDVIDMHEAFAAQILSNLQAFASTDFAKQYLGRDEAIGEITDEKFNLYGGSISLGHPFAATGARQILTMANELVRRDRGTALVTQCAAGGLGAAVILERP